MSGFGCGSLHLHILVCSGHWRAGAGSSDGDGRIHDFFILRFLRDCTVITVCSVRSSIYLWSGVTIRWDIRPLSIYILDDNVVRV